MADHTSQFVGGIPENYDTCLGPVIFEGYASDLVTRVTKTAPSSVLELASGTGIVTRKLRDALGKETRLVATDLNPPMLDVAASKFSADENVEFQEADATALPFEENTFDAIICQFGVMFFPDKPMAFSEAARVLRSGGRYLFNVWGSMSENPFSQCAHDVVREYFPDDPPGFYKVPFGYTDSDAVLADMAAGGLTDVACETLMIEKPVSDWSSFAHGLVFGNPLNDEIQERGGVESVDVVKGIQASLQDRFGTAPSTMPLLARVYSGTAP